MGRFLLYVSKEERTLEEVLANLERFDVGLEIPETFCGNLDDPEFVDDFNFERKHISTSKIEWLNGELKKAEENHESESSISDIKRRIAEEEACTNALKSNDIAGWLTCKGYYTVREGKVYTTLNELVRGFIEEICEEPSEFLIDIEGNEVESCESDFLDYDALNEIDNIFYIVHEDKDDAIYCEDDYIVYYRPRYINHNATIPPHSFVRIIEYYAYD